MRKRRAQEERLLAQLSELGAGPLGGDPDADFRARLRRQLMAARPETGDAPSAARAPVRRRASWLSQLATAGLAASMMLSAVLTYHSVPGDALYPLKRAAEDTLVRLSADPVDRAERELVSAQTRAEELNALLHSPTGGPHVSATLKDMAESTRSGISKLPRSAEIKKFAETQRNMIEPMLDQMDGDQQQQVYGYLDYIAELEAPQ
ncbi:DUF5667 domain-containing protein [Nonomuraea soli]|uniref:DUF5667 domain-containing protein n=1 Tax=Nonomuraea soli TaxID=1032476 RepID=A0A7W0CHZ2_9ACTN|nr:DUF5667 domain-containing protein [Nonomuraea soli]MBA2891275.1 hypothetical protein [Nonomuraea soli]